MNVTRVFHPIGQGAFYTELFKDEQSSGFQPHMVVYDCGSDSKKELQEYLNDYFHDTPKQTIDAIFLSHLHSDHINGLPTLLNKANVKKIFVPILTPNRIVEALLFNKAFFSTESGQVNKFILSLISNSTKGYQVIEVEEYHEGPISEEDSFDIDDYQSGIQRIASGRPISLKINTKSSSFSWVYIPFNLATPKPTIHKQNVNKLGKEKDEVLKMVDKIISFHKKIEEADRLDYHKLAKVLVDYLKGNNSDDLLKKAYEVLFGKIDNSQSMPVFSGILKNGCEEIDIYKKSNILYLCCTRQYWYHGRCHCRCHCECEEKIPCNFLYMGDFEADNHTNFTKLNKTYYKNSYDVWDTLCGIQIPHHGSRNNYNAGLYEDRCFAVASAGSHNKHHLPNIDTLINIANQGCCPNVVTDDINTLKFQKFKIS